MCDALATTQEHAPPLCLFPEKSSFGSDLRRNLVTVPSCDLHNSKKSEDDEFLRTTLCLPAAGISGAATHQFSGKVLRGVKRSPVKYGSFAPRADAIAPPGKTVFTTDRARFDRSIEHIAKAIFFHTYGRKWSLGFAVASPQILVRSPSGQLAGHDPSLQAVQVTRDFLVTEPVLGENGQIFQYRVKMEGDMFAFAALFYETFEVYAASSPAIAAGGA